MILMGPFQLRYSDSMLLFLETELVAEALHITEMYLKLRQKTV